MRLKRTKQLRTTALGDTTKKLCAHVRFIERWLAYLKVRSYRAISLGESGEGGVWLTLVHQTQSPGNTNV